MSSFGITHLKSQDCRLRCAGYHQQDAHDGQNLTALRRHREFSGMVLEKITIDRSFTADTGRFFASCLDVLDRMPVLQDRTRLRSHWHAVIPGAFSVRLVKFSGRRGRPPGRAGRHGEQTHCRQERQEWTGKGVPSATTIGEWACQHVTTAASCIDMEGVSCGPTTSNSAMPIRTRGFRYRC